MPTIATLRADLAAAERAADDLLLSDDLACVTGAHDRAMDAVRRCRAALADAELAEVMGDPAYRLAVRRAEARA